MRKKTVKKVDPKLVRNAADTLAIAFVCLTQRDDPVAAAKGIALAGAALHWALGEEDTAAICMGYVQEIDDAEFDSVSMEDEYLN